MRDNPNPSKLPLKDELFLSPIEKYKIYGNFPWRMLINVVLAISTTTQILIVIGSTTSYTRAEERFFHEQFVTEPENSTVEYPKKTYIYTVNDLKNHVIDSIDNYYKIGDISLENLTYTTPLNETQIPMQIFYINTYYNISNKKKYDKYFILKDKEYGPFDEAFDNELLKEMIKSMKYFTLSYTLKSYVPFNFADYSECFIWNLEQVYSFEQRSHFSVTLNINRETCPDEQEVSPTGVTSQSHSIIKSFFWIHVIVAVLSLINMIITLRYLFINAKIYWHIKSTYRNIYEEVPSSSNPAEMKKKSKWDLLTPKDKNRIFSLWNVVNLVGNLAQFFGALFSLTENDHMVTLTEIMVGFGCFMAYINISRYLDYIREYATIFNTISKSIPNVLRYFLGVLPIFLGFIFFGVAIFWRSERFASIPMATVSLFAMMNGDSIYDIIKDLAGVNFFIGQIYAYTFGILFIAVVMNIFVSIIEEAYVSSKIKNQNHWIYSFLKLDNSGSNSNDGSGTGEASGASSFNGLSDMTKDKRKICEIVRSKNILRDAINMEMSSEFSRSNTGELIEKDEDQGDMHLTYTDKKMEKAKSPLKKSKSFNFENELNKYTNKIDKAMLEAENIAKGVQSSTESQMKKELKMFLQDHIRLLENKIIDIKSKLS